MRIVTAAQMQSLDQKTILEEHIPGTILMENAGGSVVAAMEKRFGPLAGKRVTILCGKGNNGGDGMVVARRIKQKRGNPRVLLMAKSAALSKDAATMYRRCLKAVGKTSIHICPDPDLLQHFLQDSDFIVDALLGTGLSSPVSGSLMTAIQAMNKSGKPIFFELNPEYIRDERVIENLGKLQGDELAFGLQSTSDVTLKKIKRRFNRDVYEKNVMRLRFLNPNANIKFSLILGLPGDNYDSFVNSLETY